MSFKSKICEICGEWINSPEEGKEFRCNECIEEYGYDEDELDFTSLIKTVNHGKQIEMFLEEIDKAYIIKLSDNKNFITRLKKEFNTKLEDGYPSPQLICQTIQTWKNDCRNEQIDLTNMNNVNMVINTIFKNIEGYRAKTIAEMERDILYRPSTKNDYDYFLDEPYEWTSKSVELDDKTNTSNESKDKPTKVNDEDFDYDEEFEIKKGNRRMPMSEDFMKNKCVDAEFYGKLQLGSKECKEGIKIKGKTIKERYIEDMNVSQFAKEFGVSRPTFYKKVKYLEDKGIVEKIVKDGDSIYKLPIFQEDNYTLIAYNTLTELTNVFNSDAVKIYMVCNAFCNSKSKRAIQTREQFLEQLGYKPTRKLLQKVDDIVKALSKSEFIEVVKAEEIKVSKKKSIRYTIRVKR